MHHCVHRVLCEYSENSQILKVILRYTEHLAIYCMFNITNSVKVMSDSKNTVFKILMDYQRVSMEDLQNYATYKGQVLAAKSIYLHGKYIFKNQTMLRKSTVDYKVLYK